MFLTKTVVAGISAIAALASVASPASAQQPADAGCEGRFVAFNNQFFNFGSPSGNENAAAGPGLFFTTETGEEIQAFRKDACP